MNGYTKLFNAIVTSTIWREDDKTRLVWITMLAIKDRFHRVYASIPGLADLARVSITDCQMALQKLQEPDEFSRSCEFEGRRIKPIDGGWEILNGEKYRQLASKDELREKWASDKRRRRSKSLGKERTVHQDSGQSTKVLKKSTYTDTDTDTDTEGMSSSTSSQKTPLHPPNPPEGGKRGETDWSLFGPDFRDNPTFRETIANWLSYRKEEHRKKPYKPQGWKAFCTQVNDAVQRHSLEDVIDRFRKDMASGYQGIVWDKIGGVQKTDRPQELTAGQIQSELGRMRDARQRDAERGLDNWAEHNAKIEAFKAKHNAAHF